MKAIVAALAFLFLLGVLVLLLYFSGLLALILLFLGLVVFVVVLGVVVVAGLAFLVAVPYYFVTKRAEAVPGRYDLEQIKEK
jgi:hypothetical protein